MWLLLKNIVFTVLVPGTVAGYIPVWLERSSGAEAASGGSLRQVTAIALLSLGTAVYLWCVWDFAVVGRGTPAPIDAPRQLVARGPYAWVRNPMYLGVLIVILGWALCFGSLRILVYAVAVAAAVHTFVVLVEEPMLRQRFGESYLRYCASVRRWFPARPRRRHEQDPWRPSASR